MTLATMKQSPRSSFGKRQVWEAKGHWLLGTAQPCRCLLSEVQPSCNKYLAINPPVGLPAPATAEGMSHLAENSLAVLN